MFETIIVPLDGSSLAEAVLPRVQELAQRFQSRVILVQAVESMAQRISVQTPLVGDVPSAAPDTVELLQQGLAAEKAEAERYLSRIRDSLAASSVNAEVAVIEGNAAEAIIGLAGERGSDLIAMSTHGRGGLGRLVFGSVADHILRDSKIPVLLIRSEV